jgi:hypothetical protein
MSKLTEDMVIDYLSKWLQKNGWKILEQSKGHVHGIDLKASRGNEVLIVEAKGSSGNPQSHVTKRIKFDCGQIKTHFGKALVKTLEERPANPNATFAIAQPDNNDIRKCLQNVIHEVKKFGIKIFWVESSNKIIEEL